MSVLLALPVVLSCLLMGAHLLRWGQLPLVVLCALLPLLLLVRSHWVPRLFTVILLLGSLEWLRTTWELVHMRMAMGQPWLRMVFILGSVALVTAASALVFRTRRYRMRYSARAQGA